MAVNINVKDCVTNTGNTVLLDQIRNSQLEGEGLLTLYLECLSKTLELTGQYKGLCASSLKSRIYEAAEAPNTKKSMVEVCERPMFKENPKLKNIIKKVKYLAKGRILNKDPNCGCCRLNNTKFSHQLSKIYSSGHSIAIGLSSALTGACTLALAGTTELITDETVKNYLGIAPLLAGMGILLFPAIEAIRSSSGKNP